MSKQIIIGKNLENGQKMVFLNLDSVADFLGVSVSTASRVTQGGDVCAGWMLRRAEQVFAVKLKGEPAWRVVTENGRGTGYVEYGNPFVKFGRRDVEQIKDVTLAWYL